MGNKADYRTFHKGGMMDNEILTQALAMHISNAIQGGIPPDVVENAVLITDTCPHCKKDTKRPGTISSTYNEAAGLFFVYVLCDRCARDLQRTSQKWKSKMTDKIERNLIDLHNLET